VVEVLVTDMIYLDFRITIRAFPHPADFKVERKNGSTDSLGLTI
jgi:hypothetical protein